MRALFLCPFFVQKLEQKEMSKRRQQEQFQPIEKRSRRSASSSSSNQREEEVDEIIVTEQTHQIIPDDTDAVFKCMKELYDIQFSTELKLSEKDAMLWTHLNDEVQKLCLKSVIRSILFRSSRNETITRAQIGEVITTVGGAAKLVDKRHTTAILYHANEILKKDFGYHLLCLNDLRIEDGKDDKTTYYLQTTITSSRLLKALAELNQDKAYQGFAYVVFAILFTQPNRRCTLETLSERLREVDDRFPSTIEKPNRTSLSSSSMAPVEELKADLHDLINRMKKVSPLYFTIYT